MLVLYMLHASETGVLRFNEIRRLMTDCSQKMLSQTLKNLQVIAALLSPRLQAKRSPQIQSNPRDFFYAKTFGRFAILFYLCSRNY